MAGYPNCLNFRKISSVILIDEVGLPSCQNRLPSRTERPTMKTTLFIAFLISLLMLPAAAANELAAAEQNLRISKETLRQIEADLAAIKADPNADPTVVKEFEAYAQRSRDIVSQNQTKVDALIASGASRPAPPAPPRSVAPPPPQYQVAKPKVDMRKEIDQDPLARLNGLLDKSISDFDAKLLRRMEKVDRSRTSGTSGIGAVGRSAPGQPGSPGAEGLGAQQARNGQPGQQGQRPSQQGQQGGIYGQGGQQGQQVGQNGQQGQPGGRPGMQGQRPGDPNGQNPTGEAGQNQAGSVGQSNRRGGAAGSGTGTANTRTGSTRGGGADEDIVARQLREAAERETDPALKEKLWKEYESYKRGR